MSNIVKCLKLLSKVTTHVELAKALELNWLHTLELIGKINALEPGLINNSSADGFILTRKLNWLDENKILAKLAKLELTYYTLKILPEIDSTHAYVLNNLASLANKTIIITEFQLNGRGRGDKRWTSKIANGLAVSILYFFESDFNPDLLPLIIAIAVNRLLKQFRVANYIKWPNDIYLENNTKAAGILLESGMRLGKRFVVMGIGLNNSHNFDRNELLSSLINHVDCVLQENRVFGFALLRQEWIDNCLHHNKIVNLYQEGKLIDSGINIGLTVDGQLIVKSKNKENQYMSGNFSLLVDGMK